MFDNQTNAGRVQKILGILDLIEASAKSNRASPDEIDEMLKPLTLRLDLRLRPAQSAGSAGTSRQSITDQIRQAPISEVSMAIAAAMLRVDDALHSASKGEKVEW